MRTKLSLVHDMSAPSLTPDRLSDMGGEPRIRDVDLADRLGFATATKIRELIDRNAGELRTYGPISATVAETTAKGGRPGKTSWLLQRRVRDEREAEPWSRPS